jgi:hypothetical protein
MEGRPAGTGVYMPQLAGANLCQKQEVVIGGSNSAGQALSFLAGHAAAY